MTEKDHEAHQPHARTATEPGDEPAGSTPGQEPPGGADAPHEADAPGEEPHVSKETAALIQQLEEVQAERDRYRDQAIRAVADMENLRRRVSREKDELRKYGTSDLVQDVLPALDNLRLGLKSARDHHPEAASILDGFAMVEGQLLAALEKNGLTEINPEGADFDPNLHEATGQVPSPDIEEGKVAQVLRTGYQLNDRLIRPATVIVSAGPPEGGPNA